MHYIPPFLLDHPSWLIFGDLISSLNKENGGTPSCCMMRRKPIFLKKLDQNVQVSVLYIRLGTIRSIGKPIKYLLVGRSSNKYLIKSN